MFWLPTHSRQHSPQIRASIASPRDPGSPTLPAPSRSIPHRAQRTTTTPSCYRRALPERSHRDLLSTCRAVARVLQQAGPREGRIAEDRTPDHVGERDGSESAAVGALFRAVAEERAGAVLDPGDTLQEEPLRDARIAREDDLPRTRRTRYRVA